MKKANGFLVKVGSTATLAVLMATSTFAETRPMQATPGDYSLVQSERSYERRDENRRRMTTEGRVRSIRREREGYRIQLDREEEIFWVPELTIGRTNGRMQTGELRVGAFVRIEGWSEHDRVVRVTAVDLMDRDRDRDRGDRWNRDSRAEQRTIRGVVTDVNPRRNTMIVREAGSGRVIAVEVLHGDSRRNNSLDVDRVRRGDWVMISGEYVRGGGFRAWRIDESRGERR